MTTVASDSRMGADESAQLLRMAREIGMGLLNLPNEQMALNYTLERLMQTLVVEYGAVLLQRGQVLSISAAHSEDNRPSPLTHTVGIIDRLMRDGLSDVVVQPNIESHKALPRLPDGKPLTGGRLHTLAVMPLAAHGAAMGAIALGVGQAREFTPAELDFIRLVSMQLATRLREARLQATLDQATGKLAEHGEVAAPAGQSLDPLTNLANRQYFIEELQRVAGDAVHVGGQLSILMVDIDCFKEINDAHGHAVGDEVLCRIAETIHASIRGRDMAARYAGDKFCVLLPNTPGIGSVVVAERLRERIAALAFQHGEQSWSLTVGIGSACLSKRISNAAQLIAKAESCLYQAKQLGSDQISIDWDEAMEGMEE